MAEKHYNITAYTYKILYFNDATRDRRTIHDIIIFIYFF